MERTFVMVKPDGVQRGLVAQVIAAIEQKGYKLAAIKMLKLSPEMASRHYAEHVGKPFYQGLVEFITSGPVVAMVWEGSDVVKGVRTVMGATNPLEALPGTIRGSFGLSIQHNIVHGSDSEASADREISLYFAPSEIIEYERDLDKWY